MTRLALSTRALIAGAVCVAILGGMLVGHAWPLWTGRDVVIAATVDGTRTSAPGQYLWLSTPGETLLVGGMEPRHTNPYSAVRTIAPWPVADPARSGLSNPLRGRTVYVQLEDERSSGEYAPVSVSLRRVDGALNLRGIVSWATDGEVHVRYGLDAFYMQEGRSKAIEKASGEKRRVQIQIAIASSGRARIRNLLVDGVPVQ